MSIVTNIMDTDDTVRATELVGGKPASGSRHRGPGRPFGSLSKIRAGEEIIDGLARQSLQYSTKVPGVVCPRCNYDYVRIMRTGPISSETYKAGCDRCRLGFREVDGETEKLAIARLKKEFNRF